MKSGGRYTTPAYKNIHTRAVCNGREIPPGEKMLMK